MPRPTLSVVVVVAFACTAVAAPRLPAEKNKVRSLIGTTWTGISFEKREMVFEFQADGKVAVTYNGAPVANAGWKQDGEAIYFQLNMGYCEFDGKLKGDRIEGGCHNVAGLQWDVVLTPVAKDR
jgi:hypothetical protein